MIMRAQPLLDVTKRHFKLPLDPFHNEVRSPDDVFLSGDIRSVREAMYLKSQYGGLMAIVGESGSGKTTLVRDFKARLYNSDKQVQVIEPYVLGMEDNDTKGKTLKAQHIVESILKTIRPDERMLSSPEARFRQTHKALKESCLGGWKHVIILEEAHALPVPTLKHLKRFIDLDTGDGFTPLLTVLLIGQTELMQRLSSANYGVREVTQRCEMVTLRPLDDALDEYLQFKLGRVNAKLGGIITPDGIAALRERLVGKPASAGQQSMSFCYPLAINNYMTAALNMAAQNKVPVVDAEVIAAV